MKDWAASIIGIMFSIAVVVFTAMGKIPIEVFCSLATGAIVWFFKEKELQKVLRILKGENKGEK